MVCILFKPLPFHTEAASLFLESFHNLISLSKSSLKILLTLLDFLIALFDKRTFLVLIQTILSRLTQVKVQLISAYTKIHQFFHLQTLLIQNFLLAIKANKVAHKTQFTMKLHKKHCFQVIHHLLQ